MLKARRTVAYMEKPLTRNSAWSTSNKWKDFLAKHRFREFSSDEVIIYG
jgi:hypothetical protein